jgi:hypothetical protein
MPTVPVYGQQRVSTAPLSGGTLSPEAPSGAFQAPAPVDLSGVARVALDVQERARQQADQVAILDADNQLADLGTSIETRALSRRGKEAMGASAEAQTEWQKRTSEMETSLASDRQRQAFRQRAANRWASIHESVERHAAGEGQRYDEDQTKAALGNRVDDAARYYTDPARVATSIAEARAILKDYAGRTGMAPEELQARTADVVSKAHTGVLARFLSTGADQAASAYYEAHKTELTGDDAARAEQALEVGSTLGEGQRQADAILFGTPGPKPKKPAGLLEAGNIDLTKRPRVKNPDGSISTVRSMSFEEEGREILVPTVSPDGKILTDQQAIDLYHRTGQHLGIFKNADAASAYAQQLHEAQAAMIEGKGDGTVSAAGDAAVRPPATTRAEAFARAREITDPKIREETEKRLDIEFRRRDQAADDAQEKATNDAYGYIEQGQRPPATLWAALKPSTRASFDAMLRSMATREERQTDWPTYYALRSLSSVDDPKARDRFLRTNLLEYGDRLGKTELKELIDLQTSMRRGDGKANDTLTGLRTRDQIVSQTLSGLGIDPTPKPEQRLLGQRVALFNRRVDEQLAQWQRATGKKPTSEDVQNIVDHLVVEGVVAQSGERRRLFDVRPGEQLVFSLRDVPAADRQQITARLQREGRPVTEQAILRLFRLNLDRMIHGMQAAPEQVLGGDQ